MTVRPRASLRLEPLRDRLCPTATFSGGVITITGTGVNDTVSVTESMTGDWVIVQEQYGRAGTAPMVLPPSYFSAFSVRKIIFDGGNGDDVFLHRTRFIGIAYGGAGNDRLSGGWGADYLYGDEGNDKIEGGDGKDMLWGGADSDTLTGGNGNDELYGGDGADFQYGEAGDDTIEGGPDGFTDVVDGGTGTDVSLGFDFLDQRTSIEWTF